MEYKKDFDQWNKVKKQIDKQNRVVFFYEREIWWCHMGTNVGSEEDGKGNLSLRPVLIYKKINKHTFIGMPLTRVLRDDKDHMPFYFNYDLNSIIISQLKIFDSKRLLKKMDTISTYLFKKIMKKAIAYLQ